MIEPSMIATLSGYLVAIAVAIYNFYKGADRDRIAREKALENINTEIINKQQTLLDNLRKELNEVKVQQDHNMKEINQLKAEKDILIKVFQGRDPATVKFQEEGFKAMTVISETKAVIIQLAEVIHTITENSTSTKTAIELMQKELTKMNGKLANHQNTNVI